MKDGYYLSVYFDVNKLNHLLRYEARHDQSIALFYKKSNKISLIKYWELERFTGLKMHFHSLYDKDQALDLIRHFLGTCGLSLNDIVEILGTPALQTNDDFHSIEEYPSFSYHAISHLFSSLFIDSGIFYANKIIGLAVDGGPDGIVDLRERSMKPSYVGCYSDRGERIEMFSVSSPGLLWLMASRLFNMREGTLMALASASESRLFLQEHKTIHITQANSIGEAEQYVQMLVNKVNNLQQKDEGILFTGYDPRFSEQENKISMVMKEIQKMSMVIMDENISSLIQRYDIDPRETYLALSGGFVLNCPTNSFLMKKYKFKGFLASPCVSDSGLALGMGLYYFYKKLARANQKMKFTLGDAFHGLEDKGFENMKKDYHFFIKNVSRMNVDEVIRDIQSEPIIWFDGKAEIGPRALGNRSLLGDPRTVETKNILNEYKKREWWRPVAPLVLEEHVGEWFEDSYPSPYMLHTFYIKPHQRSKVPAIAHLDQSARVQTINESSHPNLYPIIRLFHEKTGVPMICNTSLNDKGEPIINTIEEAMNFALRKKVKVIYINGTRVELHNHEQYTENNPFPRSIHIDQKTIDEKKKSWEELNPYRVPVEDILLYKYIIEKTTPVPLDLTNKEDIMRLKRSVKLYRNYLNIEIDLSRKLDFV